LKIRTTFHSSSVGRWLIWKTEEALRRHHLPCPWVHPQALQPLLLTFLGVWWHPAPALIRRSCNLGSGCKADLCETELGDASAGTQKQHLRSVPEPGLCLSYAMGTPMSSLAPRCSSPAAPAAGLSLSLAMPARTRRGIVAVGCPGSLQAPARLTRRGHSRMAPCSQALPPAPCSRLLLPRPAAHPPPLLPNSSVCCAAQQTLIKGDCLTDWDFTKIRCLADCQTESVRQPIR